MIIREVMLRIAVCIVGLGTVPLGICDAAEGPQSEVTMSIEEVDARIIEVQNDLIAAQAERYRAKHQISYTDPAVKGLFQEASGIEGELIELRSRYDERVRILNKDVRKQSFALKKRHEKVEELKGLGFAIDREIKLAKDNTGDESNPFIDRLIDDKRTNQEMIDQNQGEIQKLADELKALKDEINESDEKAGTLAAQINDLEKQHEELSLIVRKKTDEKEGVKKLDQDRQKLVQELQELRLMRSQLKDSPQTEQ